MLCAYASSNEIDSSVSFVEFTAWVGLFVTLKIPATTPMRQAFKLGDAVDKRELDGACWPVTLFADDDFGHAGFFAGFFGVVLVAVNEHDDVCVLLNRA